jgi:DNA invertase Pin-like site-specific DNA recombinase
MNVREVYIDPGVSGVTLDRPALRRLIADCRAGKIGTVITKDWARLSRDMGQLFAVLHVFGKSGVRVEYSSREGHRDLFLETVILSAIAEHKETTARSNPKHS